MSLTGKPLLALLFLLAVGMPVGTVVLWNRLRCPRAVKGVARFGMLVTCQLTALAAVGAYVNRDFEFYTSWGDLFGTSQPRFEIQDGPGNDGQARPVPGGMAAFHEYGHGAMVITYKGPASGIERQ